MALLKPSRLIVVVLLCIGLHLGESGCRHGWIYNVISNKCYKLPREGNQETFAGAVKACQSMGATLSSFENKLEKDFLDDSSPNLPNYYAEYIWSNLIDKQDGNGFQTADGKNVSTDSFLWGPDKVKADANTKICSSLALVDFRNYKEDCDVEHYYACETPPAECPPNWWPLGDKCMRIYREPVLWLDARHMCEKAGAEMLSIENQAEFDLLKNYKNEIRRELYVTRFWMGASGGIDSGELTWSDGTKLSKATKKMLKFSEDLHFSSNNKYCAMSVGGSVQLRKGCLELEYFACMVPAGKELIAEVLHPEKTPCSENWIAVGDSCVFVTEMSMSYYDAKSECGHYYAELASVKTPEMGAFLYHLRRRHTWIGLHHNSSEDQFRWSDGSLLSSNATVKNWPRDTTFDDNTEGCGSNVQASQRNLQMFDRVACLTQLRAVCERPRGKLDAGSTDSKYDQGNCEDGWEQRPNTTDCYLFQNPPWGTHQQAQQVCAHYNATLLAVNDKEEEQYIRNRFNGMNYLMWIGASEDRNGQGWHWEDGSPFSYIRFSESVQMHPAYQGLCTALNTDQGDWYMDNCDLQNYGYICEKHEEEKHLKKPDYTTPAPRKDMFYECDEGWLGYQNRCFKIVQDPVKQSDAASICQSYGGHLASIRSKAENEFLWSQLPKDCKDTGKDCAKQAKGGACSDNFLKMATECRVTCNFCNQTCHNKFSDINCIYWSTLGTCETRPEWMQANCAQACGCSAGIAQGYWTGLSGTTTGIFSWSDDSEATYTIWLNNEPNTYRDSDGGCVMMNTVTGQWEDQKCKESADGFICAKQKSFKKTEIVDPQKVGCKELGGLGFMSKCFFIVEEESLTWLEANDYCKTMYDGHLANLNTREELDFVASEVSLAEVWVGLSKNGTEDYLWMDGSKFSFDFDLDDYWIGYENCGEIYRNLLSSYDCDDYLGFVCETRREGFSTPVPAVIMPSTMTVTCPNEWEPHNGFCYKVFGEASWSSSRDNCAKEGGWLASIHYRETNEFIYNLVKEQGRFYSEFWIGLEKTYHSGFVWHDESPVDYVNWKSSHVNRNTDACVRFSRSTKKWEDTFCNKGSRSICQIIPDGPPLSQLQTIKFEKNYCDKNKQWREYEGRCYKWSGPATDWFDARKRCISEGAELVSIGSSREQAFVKELIKNIYYRPWMWIGFNSLSKDLLSWTDGSASTYESFMSSEPSSLYTTDRCIAMHPNGDWDDISCHIKKNFMCEKPKNGIEIPSSPSLIQGKCPEGFEAEVFGNKCFYVGEKELSWDEALKECRSKADSADLASIQNDKEHMFALLLLENSKTDPWIGLKRKERRSRLGVWSNNSTLEYNRIDYAYDYRIKDQVNKRTEDNYYFGSERDCGTIVLAPPYRWVYDGCTEKRPYLCQAEKVPGSKSDTRVFASQYGDKSCPDDYFRYHGNCYKFVNESKTWGEARDFCRSKKNGDLTGDLAMTFDLYETLRFDYETVTGSIEAWIGVSHNWTNGEYEWGEGYRVEKTFWSDNDPNNFRNNVCIAMSGRFWDDQDCDKKLPFFCTVGNFRDEIPPIIVPNSDDDKPCPSSAMSRFGDSCYYLREKKYATWEMAKKECRDIGMELASIHSVEESDFIAKLLTAAKPRETYTVWIGLERSYSNTFEWADLTDPDYFRWIKGGPNVGDGLIGTCVETFNNGYWNDADCSSRKGYLCKSTKTKPSASTVEL